MILFSQTVIIDILKITTNELGWYVHDQIL